MRLVVGFSSTGRGDAARYVRTMDEFDSHFGEPTNGAERQARREVEAVLSEDGEAVFYRVAYPSAK